MVSSILRLNGAGPALLDREVRYAIRAAGIPTFRQAIPALAAELRRCRRYERPLTILTLGLEPASSRGPDPDAVRNGRPASGLLRRFECAATLILGAILRDTTRESDIVAYAAEHHLFALFLPETDVVAGGRAAARLGAVFHTRTTLHLRSGLAAFPADGLSVEDLFDAARAAWRRAPRTPVPAGEPREAPGV